VTPLRQTRFWFTVATRKIAFFLTTLSVIFTLAPVVRAESKSPKNCIAIALPSVEGVSGNALEAASGVRDLIKTYLSGPNLRVVVLDAKLASTAAEEAKEKNCEPLLFITVRHKAGGHGFMKALGQAANTSSWSLPGGGSVASAAARAGAAGGLQAAASMAQSTKAKDEISLEYRLQTADGHIELGPKTERQTAKADGEDLLTPVVSRAAEIIVTRRN
jgi:hypothetical protein